MYKRQVIPSTDVGGKENGVRTTTAPSFQKKKLAEIKATKEMYEEIRSMTRLKRIDTDVMAVWVDNSLQTLIDAKKTSPQSCSTHATATHPESHIPLIVAVVKYGHESQKMVSELDLLITHGADVNCADQEQRTVLLWAVCNQHDQVASHLISNYKDRINFKHCDKYENTALHYACMKGMTKTADLLMEYVETNWAVDLLHSRNKVQFNAEELALRNEKFTIARKLQALRLHFTKCMNKQLEQANSKSQNYLWGSYTAALKSGEKWRSHLNLKEECEGSSDANSSPAKSRKPSL